MSNLAISCTPSVFNSLIHGYFADRTQRSLVKGYTDAMLAATDVPTGRKYGYNILREIAAAAKTTPQPDAATGSALAVETLECIYNVADTANVIKPASPGPGLFIGALDHAAGGGFEVRGGPDDPTFQVQAATGDPLEVISGIAPAAPKTATWWNQSLDGQRVLFYGEPDSPSGYHWSVVPRSAGFDPALVVTTCVDDDLLGDNTLMVSESGVGILAFADAGHIGCGAPPVTASAGRFDLLRHLADLGHRLLVPEPVQAAVALSLVGGSAKGVKSFFNVGSVQSVELRVLQQPTPNPVKVGNNFSVKFQAKEPDTNGRTVNGTIVTVSAVNNNGVPTALFLDPPDGPAFKCGEPSLPPCSVETTSVGNTHGLAEFVLSSTKPGALKLLASGAVDGRTSQVKGTSTNKFNVKP